MFAEELNFFRIWLFSFFQDLVMGYNDLLLIPSGATNIRITEVRFLKQNKLSRGEICVANYIPP